MLRATFLAGLPRRRRPARFTPTLEALEGRALPAVSALFSPLGGGVLTVLGDDQDNVIAVGRDAAGAITVNGGAVPVIGGAPTVSNTAVIRIFGLRGNEQIRLDE